MKITKARLRKLTNVSEIERQIIFRLLSYPENYLNDSQIKNLVARKIANEMKMDAGNAYSKVAMFYDTFKERSINEKKVIKKAVKSIVPIKIKKALSKKEKKAIQLGAGAKAAITRRINKELAKAKREGRKLSSQDRSWITIRAKNPDKYIKDKAIAKEVVKKGKKEFTDVLLNKDKVRKAVVELMEKSKDNSGTILTLPAFWELEKQIITREKLNGLKFLGCEFNPVNNFGHVKRVRKMRKVLSKNSKLSNRVIGLIETPISTMINAAIENNYAHAILDYCGNAKTYVKEIELALTKKIIKVGGIVMITCTKHSRRKAGENASITFAEMLKRNPNYKIEKIEGEEFFEYGDGKNGSKRAAKMTALILRRIK
jgi:hypothetical protein